MHGFAPMYWPVHRSLQLGMHARTAHEQTSTCLRLRPGTTRAATCRHTTMHMCLSWRRFASSHSSAHPALQPHLRPRPTLPLPATAIHRHAHTCSTIALLLLLSLLRWLFWMQVLLHILPPNHSQGTNSQVRTWINSTPRHGPQTRVAQYEPHPPQRALDRVIRPTCWADEISRHHPTCTHTHIHTHTHTLTHPRTGINIPHACPHATTRAKVHVRNAVAPQYRSSCNTACVLLIPPCKSLTAYFRALPGVRRHTFLVTIGPRASTWTVEERPRAERRAAWEAKRTWRGMEWQRACHCVMPPRARRRERRPDSRALSSSDAEITAGLACARNTPSRHTHSLLQHRLHARSARRAAATPAAATCARATHATPRL
eukprot:366225-Chlamydomonas_euryale.AAC.20